MNFLLFLAPFSWGTEKREAAAPKGSGCFMGGTCAVREERAQELARSSAQGNSRQKKVPAELSTIGGHGERSARSRRHFSKPRIRRRMPRSDTYKGNERLPFETRLTSFTPP
jgi:hypothetical protein